MYKVPFTSQTSNPYPSPTLCTYCTVKGSHSQALWTKIHAGRTVSVLSTCGFSSLLRCTPPGWVTPQHHACLSPVRICSDNCTCECCRTKSEAGDADQIFCLTQSWCTETRPTSPSTNPMMLGDWHGNHWRSTVKAGIEPRSAALKANILPQGQ